MEGMKTCFKCLQSKPLAEFYKHSFMADGHLNKCKECTKKDVKERRYGPKREYVLAYDRMRGATEKRLQKRREYAKTEAGKKSVAVGRDKNREKFPEKYKARTALGNAVRNGTIVPWPVCAIPECCKKPQAHHPDYSEPLSVVWLCDWHHKQAHKIKEDKC